MREIIPFEKNIVFPNKISSITSISLDHEEKVSNGEIDGEFIVYGDYKVHLDTTEKETFRYKLPFTTILSDRVKEDTVKVDVHDFTYDMVEDDVMKVIIEYQVEGEEREEVEVLEDEELDQILDELSPSVLEEKIELDREEPVIKKVEENEKIEEVPVVDEDYVLYHIHIVEKDETLESILKKYEISLDDLKDYNDMKDLDVGKKIIIPYHE